MKRFISLMLLAVLLATTVHVGITAYSAQKAQKTQATQVTEATELAEPEVVDETPEFSEDETTTTAAPEPTTEPQKQATVGKTVTKAAAPQEFAEVSEIAVFQQQEPFVEEPLVEDAVTEKETTKTEETTGYEPVYDDPLPPEGADWIE